MPENTNIYALPRLSMRWVSVWRRNFLVWYKLIGPALLGNIMEPLLYLIALGYGLGHFVGEMEGVDYLTFLASGFICASAMNTATFEGLYSAYTRMAVQRTWEGMLAAPLQIDDIILGEVLWAGTKSLISGTIILLVAYLLGAVSGPAAVLALPAVLLLGVCFASMALVITAVASSYDFFMYYFTLLVTPMFLFSGVFFPVENLTPVLGWVAQLLPLTHGVALVRPLVTGQAVEWPLFHIAVLMLYICVTYYFATALLRRRMCA